MLGMNTRPKIRTCGLWTSHTFDDWPSESRCSPPVVLLLQIVNLRTQHVESVVWHTNGAGEGGRLWISVPCCSNNSIRRMKAALTMRSLWWNTHVQALSGDIWRRSAGHALFIPLGFELKSFVTRLIWGKPQRCLSLPRFQPTWSTSHSRRGTLK